MRNVFEQRGNRTQPTQEFPLRISFREQRGRLVFDGVGVEPALGSVGEACPGATRQKIPVVRRAVSLERCTSYTGGDRVIVIELQ